MRVLVPDLPEFRALSQPGEGQVPGAELDFYSRGQVPVGEAQGVVLWLANAETRERLLAVSGLKWLLTLTAGIDHVQGHLPPGVTLFNANQLHDQAVAEHVVAGMLGVGRGFYRFRDAQAHHEWASPRLPSESGLRSLRGQKVVIWGYGHIGRLVEQLLVPFGPVIYGLRSKTEPDLAQHRLAEADWVILLLPSTDQTRGIVNAELLGGLKKGVWLSNQGRGDLIVKADLIAALESGRVGGAVLDVTSPEPLPASDPLWSYENVIITPHIASTTTDLVQRGARLTRDFLLDLIQGREPEGKVSADRSY
ncbi:NAD(P)-dependent oxidoreductase [Deinococcus sp.]|uniref:NAD(P)-dependent oxidoreductase n=1 Tax=Deinococcus sp. TaxID=47478 RepID=UPI0025C1592C|nr:NAD(P)-dependent oxidoreductase [Deinococcus sp.]